MTNPTNNYCYHYSKAIKYSAHKSVEGEIGNSYYPHIYNSDKAPILADALEESDTAEDQDTLDHLRNHSGPHSVERIEQLKGPPKYKIRAVRPIYGNIGLATNASYDALEHMMEDTSKEGLNRIANAMSEQYGYSIPEYLSEQSAGGDDEIYKHGNYIISHNPRLGYIGLEHVKHVPLDEYTKIKKLTDERLSR